MAAIKTQIPATVSISTSVNALRNCFIFIAQLLADTAIPIPSGIETIEVLRRAAR
jgi:hypothetical protein